MRKTTNLYLNDRRCMVCLAGKGPRVRGREPVRGAGEDTVSQSWWCKRWQKEFKLLECILSTHITGFLFMFFSVIKRVYFEFLLLYAHFYLSHTLCIVLLIRVFPSLRLKQSWPCKMQAAVDATLAQDEESIQNHHKSPPRTQTDGYNCCKLEKENPIFALTASRNASVWWNQ